MRFLLVMDLQQVFRKLGWIPLPSGCSGLGLEQSQPWAVRETWRQRKNK